MVTISLLVLRNCMLASVWDTALVFGKVNELLQQAGKAALFKVQLVGFTREVVLQQGTFTVKIDATFENAGTADLIVIPELSGHAASTTYINKDCAQWLADEYKAGASIASLGTGTFLLAFSGVLAGKQCTTHWAFANEFRYYYPSSILVDEKVITDQDGLYSSGGGNAYWNLLMHLAEKYAGRETAIKTAKYFAVDLDRDKQSAFIIFQGLKDHGDLLVLQGQNYIEQNYADRFTVDQLAGHLHVARRTFERRFKKATRNTVAEYIQRVRVEAAKKLLEIGRKSINEVMYDVGYTDVQTFREIFKVSAGMTPVEYRNKYN